MFKNMNKHEPYEAIVIGAGIMGSTSAYYLSQHFGTGKVLLLEQFDWLHRKGSSHGESRIIRRTYKSEIYTYLMSDAYKLWESAEAESNTSVLTVTGGLDFCLEGGQAHVDLVEACKKQGVEYQELNGQEIKAKFPTVHLPPGFVAIYSPDSGILNATKAVQMFQSLTRANGGHLTDNSPVTGIQQIEDLIKVTCSTGAEFWTKKCCIVPGPWAGNFLRDNFNLDLPLAPKQTTVAYWKVNNPSAYSYENFPIFISYDEPLVYGTPIQEHPGLIKCCPHSGPGECDPDKRDYAPDMNMVKTRAEEFLSSFFEGVELNPLLLETCVVTETPDEDYIVDKLPGNDNIVIGCGFSGHGFKLGPVVGKMLAQLVIDGSYCYPDVQEHFKLDRFKKVNNESVSVS